MRRMRGGLSLIELLVGLTILSLLSALSFQFFAYGLRSFQRLVAQQGLETQLRRSLVALRRDLSLTNGHAVARITDRRVSLDGRDFDRHALCFPARSDWRAPGAFEPVTGLPVWDRYLLYQATMAEAGELMRIQLDPPGGPFAAGPLADFTQNPTLYLQANPSLIPHLERGQALASGLLEFVLTASDSPQDIHLNLKLLERHSGPGGSRMKEIDVQITALNTYPQI